MGKNAVLVEAANHSLATSTWKQYQTVWARLKKITRNTGVVFCLPMSALMVHTFTAYFLAKGLRAQVMQGQLMSYRTEEGQSNLALALKALSDQAKNNQRALKLKKEEDKECPGLCNYIPICTLYS